MLLLHVHCRYPNINTHFFKPHQVQAQYDGTDQAYLQEIVKISQLNSKRYGQYSHVLHCVYWYYVHVHVLVSGCSFSLVDVTGVVCYRLQTVFATATCC